MAKTVVGLFDNASDAQQAVEQLVKNGFSRDNIDVTSRNFGSGSASETGTSSSSGSDSINTDITGGYTSGDYTGSSYAGTGSDALSTNLSTDSNYASDDNRNENKGGSAIGNFFRSLFGNDDEADTYSNVANKTGSIVTVHAQTSEQAEEAADILDDAGAVDVNERASQYGYTANRSSATGNSDSYATTNDTTSATSLPVIEEELQVGKKTVETGGKRLRSRIVERPVEEDLRLREERVWVERNSVDRPATEADFAKFQDKEIELVEHAEIPVVSKEARVVEEISLGKEVDERVETIRDTVRNTEVDVEDIEKGNLRKSSSSSLSSDDLDDLDESGSRKNNF